MATATKPNATADTWFEVDKEGLGQLLKDRYKIVAELLQNAWDENASYVSMTLEKSDRQGLYLLEVEDDDPDGFDNLRDAYTLFAPSGKKGDTSKRGRFNLGEKLVLALCQEASLVTTTGSVFFNPDGTRTVKPEGREHGSKFSALIRFTADDARKASVLVDDLIPPNCRTIFNGQMLAERQTLERRFKATLRTEQANADGIMRELRRKTYIELHVVREGEKPHLYEMGIPVVSLTGGMPWHVNVLQRVPLNFQRDNVKPSWLKELRVAILEETATALTDAQASAHWTHEAFPGVSKQAQEAVIKARYGSKVVSYDPSDPEGNKLAVARGYTVVYGASLTQDEWNAVRQSGMVKPAGQVTPSPKAVTSAEGKPPIPPEKWTEGQKRIAQYAAELGKGLLGFTPKIQMQNLIGQWAAAYGSKTLIFNLASLGHRWFDQPNQYAVDALLLHEFAHEVCGDHLSERFHGAICDLGARLRDSNLRLRDIPLANTEEVIATTEKVAAVTA